MKIHKVWVSIFLLVTLGLFLVEPVQSVTPHDFPVGLLLDYTYTNAGTTCGFHYNVTGWVESPYNSSELAMALHSSVTGDCLNYEDDDLIFLPSWAIYAPDTGSALMRPLFTNVSDWYVGKDLKSSPVSLFNMQDEIQVRGLTTIDLSIGSLQCWWVDAHTDYPFTQDSDFFFDVEWGILLKYNSSEPGSYVTTHVLYSTNVEFSGLTITETTPPSTQTVPTTTSITTTTQNSTNSTGSSFFSDDYMVIAGAGLVVELVVLGIIVQYIKSNKG